MYIIAVQYTVNIDKIATTKPKIFIVKPDSSGTNQYHAKTTIGKNVIKKHLNENKRALEDRATVPESHYWYQLMQPQVGFVNDFENLEKIVWRDISNKPVTTLVGKKIYLDMTCYYIPIPDKAMCAWMNSDFFLEYLRLISSSLGPAVRWKKQWIEQVYFYPEKMKKQLEKIYDLSIKDPINGKLELNILINKFFKN